MRWKLILLALGILVCIGAIALLAPVYAKAASRLEGRSEEQLAVVMQVAKVAIGVLVALLLALPLWRRDAAYVLLFHSAPAAVLGLPVFVWMFWHGIGFPWSFLEHRQVDTIAAVWLGASLAAAFRAGRGVAQPG